MSLPTTKPVVRPCTNRRILNNTNNIKVQAPPTRLVVKKRWMQYQGSENWEGLLDPLDNTLRCSEIIRYGRFVESAAYRSFDFNPSSSASSTTRVGNRSFRREMERRGAKVLRIVNSDDVITKLPAGGFVVEDRLARWVYADVGCELRLSSRDSPYYVNNAMDIATSHDLKTYLHLVDGFVSSNCPFRKMINFI